MASPTQHARALETISRDLDLVVFRLECPTRDPGTRDIGRDGDRASATALLAERVKVRHELERLRDALVDLARDIGA